jgi:hypothetical protein
LGIGALCVYAAGCHDPVTEIVVVVDSDLSVPSEIDSVTIDGTGAPITLDLQAGGSSLPATLGLLPTGDNPPPFALVVQATRQGQVVVSRSAANVRFVQKESRALLVSLLRACACFTPPCAAPSAAACADLDAPELVPLDPHHLPTLARPFDGGADGPRDGAADGDRDGPATGDAGGPDVAPDIAPDLGPDVAPDVGPDLAPPPPLGLGSPCSTGNQCGSGNCADGVCCADACGCGQCNGATPGTCVPVAAGTDPKGSCGAYTCDGTGNCRTGCNDVFGSCSTSCKVGYYCSGTGCALSTTGSGFFCVVGGCECQAGLVCQQPDAGGAGTCR